MTSGQRLALGAAIVALVGGLIFVASSREPTPETPLGVWSPEHGHWHDAVPPAGSESSPPPVGITYSPGAAPQGTPPPGMVWSPEHGHWHKAGQATGSASLPPIEVTFPPAQPR